MVGAAFGTAAEDASEEGDTIDEELDGVVGGFREQPRRESGSIDTGSWESRDRDVWKKSVGLAVGAGESRSEAPVDLEDHRVGREFEGEDAGYALWREDRRRCDAEEARRESADRALDGLGDMGKESFGGVADEEECQVDLVEWRGASMLIAAGPREEIEHTLGRPNWRGGGDEETMDLGRSRVARHVGCWS